MQPSTDITNSHEKRSGKRKDKPEQHLRLFLSVDVVGSTAYKNEVLGRKISIDWLVFFESFYTDFTRILKNKCKDIDSPELWKTLGDELIFSISLSATSDTVAYVKYFQESIKEYIKEIKERYPKGKLSLKGTCWFAGFPVYNAAIEVVTSGESKIGSSEANGTIGECTQLDFIGPAMDLGFRIAKHATEEELVVSADLALVLQTHDKKLGIFYGGKKILKGINNHKAYPIFWIDMMDDAERLEKKCDPSELIEYCKNHIFNMSAPYIIPFISDDKKFNKKPDDYDKYFQDLLDEWELNEKNSERGRREISGESSANVETAVALLKEALEKLNNR